MSGAVELRCFVTGGAGHGLGHVMRSIEIAREALERGWQVAMALRGDAGARALARERLPAALIEAWDGPEDAARPARWTLFDSRAPIAAELAVAARAGARRLVLDRIDHRDDADLTVLPHLHGRRPPHPRLHQGGPWCVIARELRELGSEPEEPRSGVLVSFGGADPHDLTAAVCDPLAKALAGPGAALGPVQVVLGRCFGPRGELLRRLGELGWTVHFDLGRREFGLLMRRSALAVCGFGTTVYELAWLGVPALYLTHHREDVPAAEALEAAGIGRSGGDGTRLDPGRLRQRLAVAVRDPDWRRRSAARGRALLGDGAGALRIVEAMAGAAPAREDAA